MVKKIGWQKYEDYLEKQLSSPLLTNIIQNAAMHHIENIKNENDDEYDNLEDYEEDNSSIIKPNSIIPLTPQLIDDISMLSNFDCWMGHTNFDLTNKTKDILNKVNGIELLKICSRYRFFIGIGQMFDFTNVRNEIEKKLLEGES